MKKGLTIALIMSLIMSFSSIGVFAETVYLNDEHTAGKYTAAATENNLETSFSWDYNAETKTLMIMGYGTIPAYNTPDLGYTEFKYEIEQIDFMPLSGAGVKYIEIGDSAFYGFSHLKTINLTSEVTKIGESAFERCKALQSFTMPDSVTEVGYGAFAMCSNLQSLTLSNNLKSLPAMMIWLCDKLEYIEIPSGVTTLEDSCLSGCYLTSIDVPDGITDIPDEAFNANSKLKVVYLPNSIKTISNTAFRADTALEKVHYDGTLEQWEQIQIVEDDQYTTDRSLDNANLYYDFEGSYPVDDGEVIKSGTYGDTSWTFTSGGELRFSGEGPMKDSPNGGDTPWIKFRSDVKSVVFEEGITRIGNHILFCQDSVKKVVIPNSVTSIGEGALSGCDSLRIVWMGSGVKTVELLAFNECDNIKTIKYNGTKDEWNTGIVVANYNTILRTADVICSERDSAPQPTPVVTKLTLKAKSYKKTIAYSWNKVDGAKKYKLYIAKGSSKKYKRVATTKKALTAKVKGLKRHSSYKAYVVAYDRNGKKLAKSKTIKVKTK